MHLEIVNVPDAKLFKKLLQEIVREGQNLKLLFLLLTC